ncbi:MAG: DUF302 domain-containing protein [Sulfurovaceae bacterium]|nr:DUF302 domain-containing protein [Sulfurovaceae bacterium]
MFNKFLISSSILLLATSSAFGASGVKFYVGKGDKEESFMNMMNNKISKIGFVLTDAHARINDAYKAKWGVEFKNIKGVKTKNNDYDSEFKETLDNIGFFSIANNKIVEPLLAKEPTLGVFTPFNLLIYKKNDENKTYVGHVMPETMLDIAGVKDKNVRSKFIGSFIKLDQMVQKNIGSDIKILDYKALPEKPMMTFEVAFDRAGGVDKFIEDFQGKFEKKFEEHKYIIAGYKNVKDEMNAENIKFDRFDAYWVYSLCHFRFSEGIFNKGRPDAGVFAPCSMYMYIDKDTNKLMIGMPRLTTWNSVMDMKDKKMVDSLYALDKEITQIMIELGAKEI